MRWPSAACLAPSSIDLTGIVWNAFDSSRFHEGCLESHSQLHKWSDLSRNCFVPFTTIWTANYHVPTFCPLDWNASDLRVRLAILYIGIEIDPSLPYEINNIVIVDAMTYAMNSAIQSGPFQRSFDLFSWEHRLYCSMALVLNRMPTIAKARHSLMDGRVMRYELEMEKKKWLY